MYAMTKMRAIWELAKTCPTTSDANVLKEEQDSDAKSVGSRYRPPLIYANK